jgi:hypothetical protein
MSEFEPTPINHATTDPTQTEGMLVPPSSPNSQSRRAFLMLVAGAGVGIFAARLTHQLGYQEGLSDAATTTQPGFVPKNTLTSMKTELPPTTETVSTAVPIGPEIHTLIERKTEYSLQDLAEYARTTEFAESELNHFAARQEVISKAPSLQDSKDILSTWVMQTTGNPLTYNLDPITGKLLPHTKPNMNDIVYQEILSGIYAGLAVLPKKLISLPKSHNIVEDYILSPNADGIPSVNENIGGEVGTKDLRLSLIAAAGSVWPTYSHEVKHITEGMDPHYYTGKFIQLRNQTVRYSTTIVNMLTHLTDISGSLTAQEILTDNNLIANCANISTTEDAACNISTAVGYGIVPESDDPTLIDLRNKQVQAINDLSAAADIDFAAVIAFEKRFGEKVHPLTLKSIADAGILNYISPIETSALGADDVREQPTDRAPSLTPGTLFINAGSVEAPQVLTIVPRKSVSGYTRSDGTPVQAYTLKFGFAQPKLGPVTETTTPNPNDTPYSAGSDIQVINFITRSFLKGRSSDYGFSGIGNDNVRRYNVSLTINPLIDIDAFRILGFLDANNQFIGPGL